MRFPWGKAELIGILFVALLSLVMLNIILALPVY